MFLGEKLRELRLKKEVRQEDVAKYCGIVAGSIGHFENCRRKPDRDIVKKFCEYFGVEEGYFYGEEKQPNIIVQFIDRLIDDEVITDVDNIPEEIQKAIMDTVKTYIRVEKFLKNSDS